MKLLVYIKPIKCIRYIESVKIASLLTSNPFNLSIANFFKYWNWHAYFSPDPMINCVFLMSFFSLILFNIFIVKSIRGKNNPVED